MGRPSLDERDGQEREHVLEIQAALACGRFERAAGRNRVEHLPLKDAYRTEQDYTARLLTFDDAAEARAAFLEKRDPVWRWR